MKKEKYQKTLLIGSILALTSIILFIISWILSYVFDLNYLKDSYFILIIIAIALILFIISFFILKKGNKDKIKFLKEKDQAEFERKMKEYYKKKDENK